MAQRRSTKAKQGEVFEILMGIGPDVLTAEFLGTFKVMMLAVIRKYEIENGSGPDKNLRAATNQPNLELLAAMFKLQRELWERDPVAGPVNWVRPIELARLGEREQSLAMQSDRTLRIIQDTLAILGCGGDPRVTAADIQKSLIADRSVLQARATLKKALMDAAPLLSQLGLLRIQSGKRKTQQVTTGLSLTPEGAKFVSTLFDHAVSAGADHHPAYRNDLSTDPGSDP